MNNIQLSAVDLLINALRSGRFRQGTGQLAGRGPAEGGWKYCCLGVACEVYQEHVGDLRVHEGVVKKTYENDDTHLPEKVRKWYGFSSNNAELCEPVDVIGARPLQTLICLNDQAKFTFKQIADLLAAGRIRGQRDPQVELVAA